MNTLLLKKTRQYLLKKFNVIPQIAIITGSGIKLFENCKLLFSIKYNNLPFLHSKNRTGGSPVRRYAIKGHEGLLKLFKVKNKNVLVFSGRKHLYQGLDITDVSANIKLANEIGVKKIIITNAAGGISKKFKTGDLMLIDSYIDLMQSTERGILSGITLPPAKIKTNLTSKLRIKKGTYAGVLGPSYETYSEIKLLQLLKADAVGMSTIPEIICAKSLGMDYAAISVISNSWSKKHKPSHKEVLHNVNKANKKLNDLILRLI
ncbi:MAG: hypothetical protein A3B68_04505 [Candidatus Melainabacteria bacterium RIFCSPHIGHO2_02_FULL_34_12]|nr:MAG: hypothetical protein A3B68_04505 [Candidatus Melainabacteria bacterium RIFCSPHIGHO2_02_FULL_34_12]